MLVFSYPLPLNVYCPFATPYLILIVSIITLQYNNTPDLLVKP